MGIKENIEKIKKGIPAEVTIVAAVKYADKEQIKELIENGITDIGFNTFQQLKEIKETGILDKNQNHTNVRIHFIGSLQKNKVKKVLESDVFLIQSIDSIELAEIVNKTSSQLGIKQNILLQIRTDQKKEHGIEISEINNAVLKISQMNNIKLMGLMTLPPIAEKAALTECLKTMKLEYDKICKAGTKLEYLSMGTSEDYALTIENGANMVRIGRAFFE
ncbi:MAG: alanine racemase [Nanoarchaeota archaeon]|nr:alanine racemase [Nanoarchaeota archaeon]